MTTLQLLAQGPYGLSGVTRVGAHTYTATYRSGSASAPVLIQVLDGGACVAPAARYSCRVLSRGGTLLHHGAAAGTVASAIDLVPWRELSRRLHTPT